MKIDYIEFASPKLEETQGFFAEAFGWSFVDYGPDYRDIQGAGTGGGLERAEELRAPLVVLKTDDLKAAFAQVKAAGATITREVYDFPGGRRFEFIEHGGTAMAVWADPE